jgi:hypothetical protein
VSCFPLRNVWRTHSCVPRSHSCERLVLKPGQRCRDESRHGTQECVRHTDRRVRHTDRHVRHANQCVRHVHI